MNYKHEYRPLNSASNWINFSIAKADPSQLEPHLEHSGFLVIHSAHALHETLGLPSQSLARSWQENEDYFRQNDHAKLAPLACHPLYIISVGTDDNERAVYIGKTTSRVARFAGGHKAITLLHHPKYDGRRKTLYRCSLVFLSRRNKEIPVEWVSPYDKACKLLADIENLLIFHFQPELNTMLKKRTPSFDLTSLHIQNICGESDFLHDQFVYT